MLPEYRQIVTGEEEVGDQSRRWAVVFVTLASVGAGESGGAMVLRSYCIGTLSRFCIALALVLRL